MKRLILSVVMLLMFPGVVMAATVNLYVDGELIQSKQPAFLDDSTSRVFVPLRVVSESLGCEVNWEADTNTAVVKRDGNVVTMAIGSKQPEVNGKAFTIDAPAMLQENFTVVPLRFVSEALGEEVTWVASERAVYIGTKPEAPAEKKVVEFNGQPVDKSQFTVAPGRGMPVSFSFPNAKIMEVTHDDFKNQSIKMGDEKGWKVISDVKMDDDYVYVTVSDCSSPTAPMIVLAEGNDLSHQRAYVGDYNSKSFTHKSSVSTSGDYVNPKDVTDVYLMYAGYTLKVNLNK